MLRKKQSREQEKHLNGLRQSFSVWSAQQPFVRCPIDKSVNLCRFIRSSTDNLGQCSTMALIDALVKFLHNRKYKSTNLKD